MKTIRVFIFLSTIHALMATNTSWSQNDPRSCLLRLLPPPSKSDLLNNTLPGVSDIRFGHAGKLLPDEHKNLVSNLNLMGINNSRYDEVLLGGPKEWEMFFHYGLGAQAFQNKAHLELGKILTTNHADLNQLRQALDNWSLENQIGFKFAFQSEIEELGKDYLNRGLITDGAGEVVASNGYITDDLYNLLIQKKVFPISDPHDVLSHLPSLTEPKFMLEFSRYSDLVMDINKKIGGRPSPDRIAAMKKSDNLRERALIQMWEELSLGTVRVSTVENWTYLVKGPDQSPSLFMQGNASFNGTLALLENRKEIFIRQMLNVGAQEGTTTLSKLPGIAEFIKKPAAKKAYDRYKELLVVHGMDPASYAQVYKKLDDFVTENNLFPNLGKLPFPMFLRKPPDAKVVLDKVADFISQDPQLSVMFSKSGREELMTASMDFYEQYGRWVDSSY